MKIEFELHVKQLRVKKRLTQKELARKANLTQSYIAKLESTNRTISPTLRSIAVISKVLGVCPYKLVVCGHSCTRCNLQ